MEKEVLVQKDNHTVTEKRNIADKQVFIFDVDGTLTESKSDIAPEMASLVCSLLEKRKVALLGGGTYDQLCTQCADKLPCLNNTQSVPNLLLSPVSGGALYTYNNNSWENIYNLTFTDEEKKAVIETINKACSDINYTHPETTYGDIIEDRGAQVTFSALGQKAPIEKKREWNKTSDIRPQLKKAIQTYIPNLSVRIGGTTSVDIGKVDKAYGVEQIGKIFNVAMEDMLFIGDSLQEGGNDYDVLRTGIDAIHVADHVQTENLLSDCIQHP